MNIFTKVDGSFSLANSLNVLVLLASALTLLVPVWEAFIPKDVMLYITAGIATLNVVIRVLSNGAPITGSAAAKARKWR
jgi:hypothetical protein